MQTIPDLVDEIKRKQENDQQLALHELGLEGRHQETLQKADELKTVHIVQSKLLSDQLSGALSDILAFLQNKKPEITKKEVLLGVDQIISNLKKLSEVLPKELQTLGTIIDKPKENYWTEERLTKILKSSYPQFPDIHIPEPKDEVRVTDLGQVIDLLNKISNKPEFEKTTVSLPPLPEFPRQISVNNLDTVEGYLTDLIEATRKIDFKDVPEVNIEPLIKAVNEVQKAIDELTFPVPNLVFPKDSRGNVSVNIASTNMTSRFDIQPDAIYEAEAVVGTAESTAAWVVTKYDLTDLTNASGKLAVNVAWTMHASEVYV